MPVRDVGRGAGEGKAGEHPAQRAHAGPLPPPACDTEMGEGGRGGHPHPPAPMWVPSLPEHATTDSVLRSRTDTRSSGRGLAEPCKARRPPSRTPAPAEPPPGVYAVPGVGAAQIPSWAGPGSPWGHLPGVPAFGLPRVAVRPSPISVPACPLGGGVTCQSAVSMAPGPEVVQGGCVRLCRAGQSPQE